MRAIEKCSVTLHLLQKVLEVNTQSMERWRGVVQNDQDRAQ